MGSRAERLAGVGTVVVTASFLAAMLSGCGIEGPGQPHVMVGEDSNAAMMITWQTGASESELRGTYDAVTEATGQRLILHGTVEGVLGDRGEVLVTLTGEASQGKPVKLVLSGTETHQKSGDPVLTLEIPNVNGPIEDMVLKRGTVGEYNQKAENIGTADKSTMAMVGDEAALESEH